MFIKSLAFKVLKKKIPFFIGSESKAKIILTSNCLAVLRKVMGWDKSARNGPGKYTRDSYLATFSAQIDLHGSLLKR